MKVELEQMDYEKAKDTAKEMIRQGLMMIELNTLILENAERKLKSYEKKN